MKNVHQKWKILDFDMKQTNLRKNHLWYLHIKFEGIQTCGFEGEDEISILTNNDKNIHQK